MGGKVSAAEPTWLASKDAKYIFWCGDLSLKWSILYICTQKPEAPHAVQHNPRNSFWNPAHRAPTGMLITNSIYMLLFLKHCRYNVTFLKRLRFFFFLPQLEMNFSASAVLCFNKSPHSSLWQLALTKRNHSDSSVCVAVCAYAWKGASVREIKRQSEREEGHRSGSVRHELFAYTIITTDA